MDNSDRTVRILVRLSGELATKSRRTRRRFQSRLIENMRDALTASGIDFKIDDEWGRLFVEASSRAALEVIPRVFGVSSVSEIEATADPRLADIIETGQRVYSERVRGRKFAVRARRAGRHPFTSRDIKYELGAVLNRDAEVDLDDPDVAVSVEVREHCAYFFSRQQEAAGGLPVGVEGRALSLISGGYDSAVAAWMMLKRGVDLDFVFCNLAGAAYERAVLAVVKQLTASWAHGTRPHIHVVEFEQLVADLKERVREKFWQVALKRLMYRAAEKIAREIGAHALITGESMGQVSSQTLPNLSAISGGIEIQVLRPLIGFDKREIIDRSRVIGTYALSEKVREYCALTEHRPVTDSTREQVAAEVAKLDLAVLDGAVAQRRVLDVRALTSSDLVMPYLYASEIPPGAIVVDTRSRAKYDAWHIPGASHRDLWDLSKHIDSLDRDETYVLYCELGMRTARLVEKMQRAGFEAYSFKGGAKALRERVR